MKWYEKFEVGQEVRVVKKILDWNYDVGGCSWNCDGFMDKTLGKVYTIKRIGRYIGYLLNTTKDAGSRYWYPVESLQKPVLVGEQLLFNFMNEKE